MFASSTRYRHRSKPPTTQPTPSRPAQNDSYVKHKPTGSSSSPASHQPTDVPAPSTSTSRYYDHRQRPDAEIEPFVPSLSSTGRGYTSESQRPSAERGGSPSSVAPAPSLYSYRRPSHTSRPSYESDTGSLSRYASDSPERKLREHAKREKLPSKTSRRDLSDAERLSRPAVVSPQPTPSPPKPPPPAIREVKREPTPVQSTSLALVRTKKTVEDSVRDSEDERSSKRSYENLQVVPTSTALTVPSRREKTSSSSSVEVFSDGSRKTTETTVTSVGPSTSTIQVGLPATQSSQRQGSFDGVLGRREFPLRAQPEVIPEDPSKPPDPPRERSYPSSPPPAPLLMPLTLPDRNSVVEVAVDLSLLVTTEKKPRERKHSRKRSLTAPPKVLAITAGPVDEDGLDQMNADKPQHPNWPKYLRLPQSPMSVADSISTPELLASDIPRDEDLVLYLQQPLPAVEPAPAPEPAKPLRQGRQAGSTKPRNRRRSTSSGRFAPRRKESSDDSSSIQTPPAQLNFTTPRAKKPPSPVIPPFALVEAASPPTRPDATELSPVSPVTSITSSLASVQSAHLVSVRREDASTVYFDLQSPSFDKVKLLESNPSTPAPDVAAQFLAIESVLSPVPIPPLPSDNTHGDATPRASIEKPLSAPAPTPIGPAAPRSATPPPNGQTRRDSRQIAQATSTTRPEPAASDSASPATPASTVKPYLPDYTRRFTHRRTSSSTSHVSSNSVSSPSQDQQSSPSVASPSSASSTQPTSESAVSPSNISTHEKDGKPAVISHQSRNSNIPVPPRRPSRDAVPPLYPYVESDKESEPKPVVSSSTTGEGSGRDRSRSVPKIVTSMQTPQEQSQLDSGTKTPIYEAFTKSRPATTPSLPSTTPAPTDGHNAQANDVKRDRPVGQNVSAALQPPAPSANNASVESLGIPAHILSKVVVEDSADDASIIGQAIDMFPIPHTSPHAFDTPAGPPFKQGRFPIDPELKNMRADSPPATIRERHTRRPSLQVQPDVRSISPLNLEPPVVESRRVTPEPSVPEDVDSIADLSLSPLLRPNQPSPVKEPATLPSSRSHHTKDRNASSSKPFTTPTPLSLRRPSMEKVPTAAKAALSSSEPNQSQSPLSQAASRDRSASSASAPATSTVEASLHAEPVPPLPQSTAPKTLHRRQAIAKDFVGLSSPAPTVQPLAGDDAPPAKASRSRTRAHLRDASGGSSTTETQSSTASRSSPVQSMPSTRHAPSQTPASSRPTISTSASKRDSAPPPPTPSTKPHFNPPPVEPVPPIPQSHAIPAPSRPPPDLPTRLAAAARPPASGGPSVADREREHRERVLERERAEKALIQERQRERERERERAREREREREKEREREHERELERERERERERLEREKQKERERIEKERLERERIELERLEKERLEKDRQERERQERERQERERQERERQERERLEMERLERERLERDRIEKERELELEKEREREREREQRERERLERERERAERERERAAERERQRAERHRRHRTPAVPDLPPPPVSKPVPPPPAAAAPPAPSPSPIPPNAQTQRPGTPLSMSDSSDNKPAAPKEKNLFRRFWKRDDKSSKPPTVQPHHPPPVSTQDSFMQRTISRPKPPTPTIQPAQLRSTPSPVPPATGERVKISNDLPSRSGGSKGSIPPATAPASANRKPAQKDKSVFGFLKSQRAYRTVSNASLEAVLGASNNNGSSTPGSITMEIPGSPPLYPDPAAHINAWRNRGLPVREDGRQRRAGVTFENLPSEPGSPPAWK